VEMIGLQEVITIAGVVAGAIMALKGIQEYRRSIMFRRAEWLYSLYRDFYMLGALKEDDVKAMFDYYLKLFYKSKLTIEYLSRMGFEYLAEYLERYKHSTGDGIEGED